MQAFSRDRASPKVYPNRGLSSRWVDQNGSGQHVELAPSRVTTVSSEEKDTREDLGGIKTWRENEKERTQRVAYRKVYKACSIFGKPVAS